jgi:hypothetical protein
MLTRPYASGVFFHTGNAPSNPDTTRLIHISPFRRYTEIDYPVENKQQDSAAKRLFSRNDELITLQLTGEFEVDPVKKFPGRINRPESGRGRPARPSMAEHYLP